MREEKSLARELLKFEKIAKKSRYVTRYVFRDQGVTIYSSYKIFVLKISIKM